jgi:hypothetical protein
LNALPRGKETGSEIETVGGAAPIGVAVAGCGYWGPNLIRNFSACKTTRVVAVCDRDKGRLERVASSCPQAMLTDNFEAVLKNPEVDAVAVATPVNTHVPLALAALEAGKDVLVEKPLAANARDAERLVLRARELGRTLMVDHTYVYSPAVRKMKELVDAQELGEIYYIDSVRINLGQFQSDVNVLWDLAPHDLAIVDYLLGRLPRSLAAMGVAHTSSDLEDVAYLNLDFGRTLMATFHVNWLSPVKLRHTIIGVQRPGPRRTDQDLRQRHPARPKLGGPLRGPRGLSHGGYLVAQRAPRRAAAERGSRLRRLHPQRKNAAGRRRGGAADRAHPGSGPAQHQGPRRTHHPVAPLGL